MDLISGSNETFQRGVYGEQGKAEARNVPDSRSHSLARLILKVKSFGSLVVLVITTNLLVLLAQPL